MLASNSFASLVLFAAAASAKRELSMAVSGPEEVDGLANLKVKTTITNTGDETLKLLNDARGPLSTVETDTFTITSAAGASPDFTGVKVKYVPEKILSMGDENLFTVLQAGQSVEVEHDLSKAYNFTPSSEGKYSIDARPHFLLVDDNNDIAEIIANTVTPLQSKVSGRLAVTPSNTLQRRAAYVGCSSAQQSQIVAAASAAQSYAGAALSYARSHTASTPRYQSWFGTYSAPRHDTVVSHYAAISGGSFSSFTYDCTCNDPGVYAKVNPNNYGYIYLCPVFWQIPVTGTDSKGGTLVHECSHFVKNGGTQDYAYGQRAARNLAASNPARAVMNADNHEYFAENNPSQS